MSSNLAKFKKKYRPGWYENGPVKIYTKEEIEEYERTLDPRIQAKHDSEMGLTLSDRKFLDGLAVWQAEDLMQDIMSGVEEGNDVDPKGFVA